MEETVKTIAPLPPTFLENLLSFAGLQHPFGRFVFGATVVNVVILAAKPSFAFDSKGNAREWRVTTNSPSSTSTPWWTPGLLGGLIFSTFV